MINNVKLILRVNLIGDNIVEFKLIYLNSFYLKQPGIKYFFSNKDFMVYHGTKFEITKELLALPLNPNYSDTSRLEIRNDTIRKHYLNVLYCGLLEWSSSKYWDNLQGAEIKPSVRFKNQLWYVS